MSCEVYVLLLVDERNKMLGIGGVTLVIQRVF